MGLSRKTNEKSLVDGDCDDEKKMVVVVFEDEDEDGYRW